MSEFAILTIFLHDRPIGTITHLPGDKNLFSFAQEYIDDRYKDTLSLSFKDNYGDLITNIRSTRTRLSPFFSNLLPEGHMRDYLAAQAKIDPQREFYLLAALGKDLPGALKVSLEHTNLGLDHNVETEEIFALAQEESILRFSLAGVQLKFSAIMENEGGLTIPVDGVGGSWIVKLPSSIYPKVPENEFVMMEIARKIGIDVPETALVPLDKIHGIPRQLGNLSNEAYITKRFDRTPEGKGIHIEDFAQVFRVYPEKKYQSASYRNIVELIFSEIGEEAVEEFIRRFVFNALIGNGDMHLKNWSLIYPDKRKAALAPAYDFVSTIPYIPSDELALTFVDSKSFHSLTYEQLNRFASKAKLPHTLVLDTARETVKNFTKVWQSIGDFSLDPEMINIINEHLKRLPLYDG